MKIPVVDNRNRPAELHVTYRCNLECCACSRGCFQKHGHAADMTEATFLATLDAMERLSFRKELIYIGGEPTLHPQMIPWMRIGKRRGFKQHVYSNAFTAKSREKLAEIATDGLARVIASTQKPQGSVKEFNNRWIFCSPVDMGSERNGICRYGSGGRGAGYSVDEAGCTPCCSGGAIAGRMCPDVMAPLDQLLDPQAVKEAFEKMCRHCGSFVQQDRCWSKCDQSKAVAVNGTLMTATWIKAFEAMDKQ